MTTRRLVTRQIQSVSDHIARPPGNGTVLTAPITLHFSRCFLGSVMKRAWIAGVLTIFLTSGVPNQLKAEIHGLVIGIDDYAFVPNLEGAVNDARDLAQALERRGANVVLLLDRDATRSRVMEEFSRISSKASPGDTIVLSYAGHGVQLPEALPGDEADGKDETFILHGFEMRGDGFSERIRDNDIADMLSEVPLSVGVLVIADSCHSGTMTRSVDPRGSLGRTRYVDVGVPDAEDRLPKPAQKTRAIEAGDFPNVVFANAARDDQQTPEVKIDGRYRGALSWSIARAFDGQADGGDGSTSLADFQGFVIEQVRALSGTRQTPGVGFVRETAAPGLKALSALFGDVLNAADVQVSTTLNQVSAQAGSLRLAPPPSIHVRSEGKPFDPSLLGDISYSKSEETARLLWDRKYDELIDRATADVIAVATSEEMVRDAVLKWRFAEGLVRWAPQRPLEFRLDPDDRRYRIGEELFIEMRQPAPEFDYLSIVNVASTGEVQFIYPAPGHVTSDRDRFDRQTGEARLGPAPVTEPTGADHVIAIASSERLDSLHRRLDGLHGRRDPESLIDMLNQYAGDATQVRIGVLPIYTEQ